MTCARSRGTGSRSTSSSTPCSSGCCGTGCTRTLPNGIVEGPQAAADVAAGEAFEDVAAGARSRPAGRLAGRARRRPGPVRPGRHRRLGPGHRGPDRPGHRGARTASCAFIDPAALTAGRRAGPGRLAGRPDRPKALHDAKGPMHALAARGLTLAGLTSDTALAAYLALPGQRSFDLADLALRYLSRELRDARPADRPAHAGHARRRRGRERAGPARPGHRGAGRRARRRPGRRAAPPSCWPRSSCRWSACWPRWSRPGSPPTSTTSSAMSASLGGEVKSAEQAAFADHRA